MLRPSDFTNEEKKPTTPLSMSSGPPPHAGAAGFQPLSFATAVPEDFSHLMPRRSRNGGYGRGRGRGRNSFVSSSSSMPARADNFVSSSSVLPPPPATPEERIDQLLERISPTEETDAARAAVFSFLRSVVDRCFSECKVKKKRKNRESDRVDEEKKTIHLSRRVEQVPRPSFDPLPISRGE